MATRDQGIRRSTTVTVGLAAASVAGAFAVGAAAAAGSTPTSTPTAPDSPGQSPGAEVPPPSDPMVGPPGDLGTDDGPPVVITEGS